MKNYLILQGTFKLDDGTVRGQGEVVALEDDVAERFRDRIRPVTDAPPAIPPQGD